MSFFGQGQGVINAIANSAGDTGSSYLITALIKAC
jgi:hypothetical protein